MPPHPRADGPHHSSAETSLPRKPSVPESISSGGFEPATSRCVARSSSLFNVAAYDGTSQGAPSLREGKPAGYQAKRRGSVSAA